MNQFPIYPPEYDAWRCQDCGTYKPVPILARDCEARHEAERKSLKSVG